jgi:phosphoglycerate dehydrogenase-like enzyme
MAFMSDKPRVLILAWLPDGVLPRLRDAFAGFDFLDARAPADLDRTLPTAAITYGLPPVERLAEAPGLRWIQLTSAGVPAELCPAAAARGVTVTNLAGLYGPTIAEHALALMAMLARNLHVALRNQPQRRWDRDVARTMTDLHGKTLAVVGLGNIGRSIARLARAYGMQVIGCRRRQRPTPEADRVYPCDDLRPMLAEADVVAVAAPLTRRTEGMLGPAEFAAMKRGVIYVNVSRGTIAQEQALLEALRSGQVAAAGLDVFAVEPLPADHPFWAMPNVIVSPHYSGETVNNSALPSERFARNLRAWSAGRPLEGVVDLECGY